MIAGVNVIAADTEDEARRLEDHSKRSRVRSLFSRGERRLTDDEVESILRSPQAAHVEQMMQYRAVGEPDAVVAYLDDFRSATGADELITVHHGDGVESRLRSVELLAEAADLRGVAASTPSQAIGAPTELTPGRASVTAFLVVLIAESVRLSAHALSARRWPGRAGR